jgi:hypothetical protein
MNDGQLTYDDVMLDWAVAEFLSPTWAASWSEPTHEELRIKLKKDGISSLTVYERSWLVGNIVRFRSPIICVYGPCRSWSFQRFTVSRGDLERFSILWSFPYPSFSFGDLSAKIKDDPSGDEAKMRDAVWKMVSLTRSGQKAPGAPIAISREVPMSHLLIDGYRRAMAALWDGCPSIEIYLCTPPAPTCT